MSATQQEIALPNETSPLFCNDPTEFCRLFLVHLQNPDETPPQTSTLAGRIVRTKTAIEASLLADEPGRDIVFCQPSDSLNQSAKSTDFADILPSLGFTRNEINDYLANGYHFYLVVFPKDEMFLADWDSLRLLFSQRYPELATTIAALWDETKKVPFDQIDSSISLPRFLSIPKEQRTAKQLRGLLFKLWRLNKDFTGTGLTSGGLPEMLMLNQIISTIKNVSWARLDVRPYTD
ncbi:MAG TPA: hypothetical protein PKJ26_02775 [Candidatus Woesebacteria bacterium]|nr:hypothetical protein [Candidatus Woesebacteria bacterium]HNS65394.1 hypothetical protein [Candidatus Woesebacteria bacterium]